MQSDDAANRALDDLSHVSDLLSRAIQSIINVNSDSDINAFLHGRTISFADDTAADDFELIAFVVVTEGA